MFYVQIIAKRFCDKIFVLTDANRGTLGKMNDISEKKTEETF